MEYSESRTDISKRLQEEGFTHLTGLGWLADGAKERIGEQVDDSDLGKWTSRKLSIDSDQELERVVAVTSRGEVWVYFGVVSEAIRDFLKENFTYTKESADLHLRFLNYQNLLIRANHPYEDFGGFQPPDPFVGDSEE